MFFLCPAQAPLNICLFLPLKIWGVWKLFYTNPKISLWSSHDCQPLNIQVHKYTSTSTQHNFLRPFWDLPSHWIVSELAGKNCDFENWRTWQWDKASYQNRVSIEISSYTFLQKSISIKLEKLVLSRCFRLKILRSKSPYKDKYHSIGLRSLLVHWWDRMYKMTSY